MQNDIDYVTAYSSSTSLVIVVPRAARLLTGVKPGSRLKCSVDRHGRLVYTVLSKQIGCVK